MAFRKGRTGTAVLGAFASIGLAFYAFGQLYEAIIPTINQSSVFGIAVTFLLSMIPIAGLLVAYKVVKPLFSSGI